ncbi:MAG: hypothetical protein M3Q50_00955, partial [Chloroflexota bacterium]|nr:hypothetical protein [Chloroflexota bacterium]
MGTLTSGVHVNSPGPRQHRPYFAFIAIRSLVVLATGIIAGCSDIDGPTGPKVSVCHGEGSVAEVREIFLSELAEHKGHGDYVTHLDVSRLNTAGDSIHFTRITDALAVARAGRVTRNELDK